MCNTCYQINIYHPHCPRLRGDLYQFTDFELHLPPSPSLNPLTARPENIIPMGNSQYRMQHYITYHGYKYSLPSVAGFIRQSGYYHFRRQGSERVKLTLLTATACLNSRRFVIDMRSDSSTTSTSRSRLRIHKLCFQQTVQYNKSTANPQQMFNKSTKIEQLELGPIILHRASMRLNFRQQCTIRFYIGIMQKRLSECIMFIYLRVRLS